MNYKLLFFITLFLNCFNLNASEIDSIDASTNNKVAHSEEYLTRDNSNGALVTLNQEMSKSLFGELSEIKSSQCEDKICTLKIASIDCQSIPYAIMNIDMCTIFPNEGSLEQNQLMYSKASKIYNILKQSIIPTCNPIGVEICATHVENVICTKETKGLFSKSYICLLTYRKIKNE